MGEKQSVVFLKSEMRSVCSVTLTSLYLRVTGCIFPWGKLKVVSLWNWPKQELREKNWSAMEALSATESMLQGKLSKAVKVRHPHLLHSSSNLMHLPILPPRKMLFFFAMIDPMFFFFPFTIIHNKAAYSFASPSPTSPLLFGLQFSIGCVLAPELCFYLWESLTLLT